MLSIFFVRIVDLASSGGGEKSNKWLQNGESPYHIANPLNCAIKRRKREKKFSCNSTKVVGGERNLTVSVSSEFST